MVKHTLVTRRNKRPTYLVEKHLRLAQNVLQLGELEKVALQRLGILVDLAQFVFQFLEGGLKTQMSIDSIYLCS